MKKEQIVTIELDNGLKVEAQGLYDKESKTFELTDYHLKDHEDARMLFLAWAQVQEKGAVQELEKLAAIAAKVRKC